MGVKEGEWGEEGSGWRPQLPTGTTTSQSSYGVVITYLHHQLPKH